MDKQDRQIWTNNKKDAGFATVARGHTRIEKKQEDHKVRQRGRRTRRRGGQEEDKKRTKGGRRVGQRNQTTRTGQKERRALSALTERSRVRTANAPNAGQCMAFEEALPASVGRGPGKLQADKRRTRGRQQQDKRTGQQQDKRRTREEQEMRTTAGQGQAWSAHTKDNGRTSGGAQPVKTRRTRPGHDKDKRTSPLANCGLPSPSIRYCWSFHIPSGNSIGAMEAIRILDP